MYQNLIFKISGFIAIACPLLLGVVCDGGIIGGLIDDYLHHLLLNHILPHCRLLKSRLLKSAKNFFTSNAHDVNGLRCVLVCCISRLFGRAKPRLHIDWQQPGRCDVLVFAHLCFLRVCSILASSERNLENLIMPARPPSFLRDFSTDADIYVMKCLCSSTVKMVREKEEEEDEEKEQLVEGEESEPILPWWKKAIGWF
ncbi:hypothetical protein Aperf_G00000060184 [Anoplocephala perfoliata]